MYGSVFVCLMRAIAESLIDTLAPLEAPLSNVETFSAIIILSICFLATSMLAMMADLGTSLQAHLHNTMHMHEYNMHA